MEKDFFRQPLGTRIERLRQYPLEDQYKIYRYGNDVVHPPLTDLAIPIAERGEAVVPFLVTRLNAERDDFSVRDILLVLERMKSLKTFDARSDSAVMAALDLHVSQVKDKDWKAICLRMLQEIKDP
jgi:hypothetical protein